MAASFVAGIAFGFGFSIVFFAFLVAFIMMKFGKGSTGEQSIALMVEANQYRQRIAETLEGTNRS